MKKLVSIIIPCYNAQAWLAETTDSCLQQTYPHVEVIVIDDCSTDDSVQILQRYGDRIRWEQQPTNQRANAARNRGLTLAKGDYIQWLDADDVLLPQKIERQVQFLEETDYEAVYGDWQAKYHYPDGSTRLSRVMEPGVQADILESLLADWWTAVASLLYRRTLVDRAPNWNETLLNGDDRHYMLGLALANAQFGYQPGCYCIYRRYSGSVSVASPMRWIKYHHWIVDDVRNKLSSSGRLTTAYSRAIATSYFKLSRRALRLDTALHTQLLQKTIDLVPNYEAMNEVKIYKLVQRTIGFYRTEQLVSLYRRLRSRQFVDQEW